MLLVIDNYDSFTYNLIHYFEQMVDDIKVVQHDKVTINDIKSYAPTAIVLSPGPKSPGEAGISIECIKTFHQTIPMLGVCLGFQCIVQAFGGNIIRANQIRHGKTSQITNTQTGIFRNLPKKYLVTRYHSLIAEAKSLPDCLSIQALSNDDETIMAIQHRTYPLYGIQFHPEAILTEYGYQLLEQFIHDSHERII